MWVLLNDRSVTFFFCITEWDNHLYNMTTYFKIVQMVLDYTYDFLTIFGSVPQNLMLKEILR